MGDEVLQLVEQHINQRSWLDVRRTVAGTPIVRAGHYYKFSHFGTSFQLFDAQGWYRFQLPIAAFRQRRSTQDCSAAVSILFKVMADPGTPTAVKVRVVECVLSHSGKAIETEDIEVRLAELERAAEASKNGGR